MGIRRVSPNGIRRAMGRWGRAALALLICAPTAAAADKPLILWADIDYAPAYIASGEHSGLGVYQKTRRYFIDRLDAYYHAFRLMNHNRIKRRMEAGENICFVGYIATDARRAVMHFSEDVIWAPSLRVITVDEKSAALDPHRAADGAVDLARLAADPTLRGGVVIGRSYTPPLDEILAEMRAGARAVDIFQESNTYEMLVAERFDWVLDYVAEAQHHIAARGFDLRIASSAIVGVAPVIAGHVACAKTPTGLGVVEAVDAIRAAAGPVPPYTSLYRAWMDPAAFADYQRDVVRYLVD